MAQGNARRHQVEERVRFLEGDLFAPLDPADRFDVIVSNPPYIAAADPHLPALRHEPSEALVAGADGLDDLRRIVAAAPAHLEPGGWLLLSGKLARRIVKPWRESTWHPGGTLTRWCCRRGCSPA